MPLNTNSITRLLPLLLNLSCDTCGKVQGVPLARVKPQRGVPTQIKGLPKPGQAF